MKTSPYELLLTFASEKGKGTWTQLRDAWTWLSGATGEPGSQAWVAARDLEALGHIEVAWEQEMAWCVAPPVLTMIPRSGGRVFVTGARTRFFSARVEEVAEDLDLWVDHCETKGGPRSMFIACSSASEVRELASILGVDYTYQVAEQVAGLLPPLATYSALDAEGELPRGLDVECFDAESITWIESESRDPPGLYRCRTYSGQVHGLHLPTGRWSRVIKEIGIYEVLRWHNRDVLRYSEERQRLTVPAEARLPALHARALTLCSGRLPTFSLEETGSASPGGRRVSVSSRSGGVRHTRGSRLPVPPRRARRGVLTYENVPSAVAERVAESLDQSLVDQS